MHTCIHACIYIKKGIMYAYILCIERLEALMHACACECQHCGKAKHWNEWVMKPIWMGHGTHRMSLTHIEWVMTHVRVSHGTRANGSWVTYGGDVSQHLHCSEHSSKSHQYRMVVTSPQHTCKCSVGMNHTFASYHSFSCVPWLLHIYDMTQSNLWHDSFMFVTLHTHTCHMTHSLVSHDSFFGVAWLILLCAMTYSYVWHDSFICVTCLLYMCAIAHSDVWHASFFCVTWPIILCAMTHSYVWHDSFLCVTWLLHTCPITHAYVWHDSFFGVIWLILLRATNHSYVWHDSFMCVTWLIYVCDMTHLCVWHDSFMCATHDSFIRVTWSIHVCDMTHAYVHDMTHSRAHVTHHSCIYVQRVFIYIFFFCRAQVSPSLYGVATISRLLKIIDLFCKRAL